MKIWIKSILKFLIFSGVLCIAFGFAMEWANIVGSSFGRGGGFRSGHYIVLASAPVFFAFVGAGLYKTFYGTQRLTGGDA